MPKKFNLDATFAGARFRPVPYHKVTARGAQFMGYGVECKKAGDTRYRPVGYQGKAVPFKTKKDANAACEELNAYVAGTLKPSRVLSLNSTMEAPPTKLEKPMPLHQFLVSIKPHIRVRDMYSTYVTVVYGKSKADAIRSAEKQAPDIFDLKANGLDLMYCKPKAEKVVHGIAHAV